MAANYVLLEKVTVGASVSSVTFNNIPQTGYTDLKIVMSNRDDRSATVSDFYVGFNGVQTNLSMRRLYGDGSAPSSSSASTGNAGIDDAASSTANTFANCELYIPNYTSSNYKSYSADSVTENNAGGAGSAFAQITAGLWSSTSAITSVTIYAISGSNFVQYSTFSLYGIAAVGTTPTVAPFAAGGDIIQTDGTYWYHAFLSSGTFTPAKSLSCDVLVVAGGGGGGSRSGGGGGAGGVLALASQSLASNTAQTVTIGAGGNGGSRAVTGTNGGNSQFGSLTAAIGGGVGASAAGTTTAGGNGGSGGGAGNNGTGGTATSGQGYAGGNSNSTSYDAAGGGGAGAVGSNASTGGVGSGAGNGGAGVNTVTNWGTLSSALTTTGLGVSGYIGGGGGGGSFGSSNHGTGGSGGGGNGANTSPTNGTANTGSGAGGAGNSSDTNVTPVGANGGSGIVIVRYLA
jgi:hypothetical protein